MQIVTADFKTTCKWRFKTRHFAKARRALKAEAHGRARAFGRALVSAEIAGDDVEPRSFRPATGWDII